MREVGNEHLGCTVWYNVKQLLQRVIVSQFAMIYSQREPYAM